MMKLLLVSICTASLLVKSVVAQTPAFSHSYKGHQYEVYTSSKNFNQASAFAATKENSCGKTAYLASITSPDENDAVFAMLQNVPTNSGAYRLAYIGLTDYAEEGTWLWSSGEEKDFTAWANGEPNNAGQQGEDCAQLGWNGVARWNDVPCSNQYYYVLEYDCDPVPASVASVSYGGHQYELYTDSKTHQEATEMAANQFNFCGERAHLATITSEEENNVVFELLQSAGDNNYALIGLHKTPSGFEWETGEVFDWTSWSDSFTDDAGKDCVRTGLDGAAKWDDVNCDDSQYYILEYDCDPVPVSTAAISYNQHYYELYTDSSRSFLEASEVARNKVNACGATGYLATVTSPGENDALFELSEQAEQKRVYIGLHDRNDEGVWEWVTGETKDWTHWYENEPNDWGTGEDCVVLGWGGVNKWNDVACTSNFNYIVEYDCNPFPTSAAAVAFEGHYYELYTEPKNFHQATEIAKDQFNACGAQAYLATITSEGENNAVFNLLKRAEFPNSGNWKVALVGLHDAVTEGSWEWVTGETFDYSAWANGQPNNDGNEDCVHTGWEGEAEWNDVSCDLGKYYILEYDCDPLPFSAIGVSYGDHYYELFTDLKTFDEASEVASSKMNSCGEQGYLATITSKEENNAVFSMLEVAEPNYADSVVALIGLHDQNDEGTWEWVTGEPKDFTAWASNEPNDYGTGEDCVNLGHNKAAEWNDIRCSRRTYYIVEYNCNVGIKSTVRKTCAGPRSKWTGDPHITTFDGIYFDCQGKGEFVMSRSKDSEFKFHARFVKVDNRPSVSVTRGVAVAPGDGLPKIAITTQNHPNDNGGSCGWKIHFDQEEVTNSILKGVNPSEDVTISKSERNGMKYLTIWYHTVGHRFVVSLSSSNYWGCSMNVNTCLDSDKTDAESFAGLIGTPDGDSANDWSKPDGSIKTIPSSLNDRRRQPAYGYCTQNWCVGGHDNSLFEDGKEAFKKYNRCPLDSKPYPDSEYDSAPNTSPDVYDPTDENILNDLDEDIAVRCETAAALMETEFEQLVAEMACKFDAAVVEIIEPGAGDEFVELFQEEEGMIQVLAPLPPPIVEIEAPYVMGDPHIKTWTGEKYDFHGVCDLVMLTNPEFSDGLGIDVHIRTSQTKSWSYVSSAVLRIGSETLEVMGGKDSAKHWINGIADIEVTDLSGYAVTSKQVNSKIHKYEVWLDSGSITIETFKDMVRVDFHKVMKEDFDTSLGLLGSFVTGEKIARDKITVIEDANEFGQMWQVLSSEDMLFHNIEGPQGPEKCLIPTEFETSRRRLGETLISEKDARIACSRVDVSDFELCVFDVLATKDLEVSGAY